MAHENWSDEEVRAIVESHFAMLRTSLDGGETNKTIARRTLKPLLHNRSDGSIEFKHQNISAVLIDLGRPYLTGYLPRENYQGALLRAVWDFLRANPEFDTLFARAVDQPAAVPKLPDILDSRVPPPPRKQRETKLRDSSRPPRLMPDIDYLARESRNRSLGDSGEKFVISFEQARLRQLGKERLAEAIEQVSLTKGPSAGFDVHSYEASGADRFIEVKTTAYGIRTPFYASAYELRFSQTHAKQYFLYRPFEFRDQPRLFMLGGSINEMATIEPSTYLARF